MKRTIVAGCLVLGLAVSARGEEFVMKDGTRIVGRIIAYESDSFRVETSFGQAIVYKDRIAKINFTDTDKRASAKPGEKKLSSTGAGTMERPEPPAWQQSLAERTRTTAPPRIVDRIEGTTYINETFRFRMFKPPSWRIFEGAARGLGAAIVVMGTEDESTLLMVGHESFEGSLDAYAAASERAMARSYGNYRKLSEVATTVNALPGIRRTFSGNIDGADWRGLVVYFARDQEHFAIVGLTSGELPEFTEGLFRKVASTFEFLQP